MTYRVTASPIRGQKIIKTVDSVREMHDFLNECRERGYDIKSVKRVRQVLQLRKEVQLA